LRQSLCPARLVCHSRNLVSELTQSMICLLIAASFTLMVQYY
jgi:hypothetical protein